MMLQSWLQIAVTLLIGVLISIPVGRYVARITADLNLALQRACAASGGPGCSR